MHSSFIACRGVAPQIEQLVVCFACGPHAGLRALVFRHPRHRLYCDRLGRGPGGATESLTPLDGAETSLKSQVPTIRGGSQLWRKRYTAAAMCGLALFKIDVFVIPVTSKDLNCTSGVRTESAQR